MSISEKPTLAPSNIFNSTKIQICYKIAIVLVKDMENEPIFLITYCRRHQSRSPAWYRICLSAHKMEASVPQIVIPDLIGDPENHT